MSIMGEGSHHGGQEDFVAITSKVSHQIHAAAPHHLGHTKSMEEARLGAVKTERFGVGHIILGVDIGGTSIKAAPVDTKTGLLMTEKHVIMTPKPATPDAVADTVAEMLAFFKWQGPVGVGLPAVVREGVVCSAANIDKSWIGANAEHLFSEKAGAPVAVVNDADAAGYSEMAFGAGKDKQRGCVVMVTFGTGIGTATFIEGILVPNMELGHVELDNLEAEKHAAGVLVKQQNLTWDQWAERVTWYLTYLERLLWPSLFIAGGGVSNASEQWLPKVKLPNGTPIVAAASGNDAGIIGAALAALASAAYRETKRPHQVDVLCM